MPTLSSSAIIPYMRANEVLLDSTNLKPDRSAYFFFDDTNVDNFVQRGSSITTTSIDVGSAFTKGEGLYCSSTRAYATVISTSSNNTVYINDNFLTLNLAYYGAAISFGANDFLKNDIIFTANSGSNYLYKTYEGRVEYFDATNKIIVVRTTYGTANTDNGANTIYKLGDTSKLANISSVVINTRFPAGASVSSVANVSNTFTVATYSHNHGTVPRQNTATNLVICLSTTPAATACGNSITITSGSGFGQVRTITSITGQNVTVNTAVTNITGNSTYSLGRTVVDDYGSVAGIFQIPSTDQYKFRTGTRVLTITDSANKDDPDNQMKAIGEFVAGGITSTGTGEGAAVDKTTPVVLPKPVNPPTNRFVTPVNRSSKGGKNEPVAQTFFTPESLDGGLGIMVSSIDLFFRNKPDITNFDPELPVTVKIVTTQNGYPTEEIVAQSTVQCKDVKVTNGTTTFPSSTDATTLTKFKFKDPVYLKPSAQYAIVVQSDSPTYEVWIAELGQTIIGDATGRRISEQPYAGSFFRSQNASTWTPFQNEDLMFVINRAVFTTASNAVLNFKVIPPTVNVGIHSMTLHSTDIAFSNTTLNYAFKSTLASSLAMDSSYTSIVPGITYNFSSDLKTSSKNTNRKRTVLAGNANSMMVQVTLSTANSTISPMFNTERLSLIAEEYVINDGGISNANITITNGGGLHSNAANIIVTISGPQLYTDDPTANATANILPSSIVSGNIRAINIINAGRGYIESPTITIRESGNTSVTTNATAVIVSEDGKSGGNSVARYVTKKVVLSDGFDAGDLRVYLDAIRPQGTNIIAYYKVLSASDSDQFEDKTWKRMYLATDLISPDTITPVELIFRPSESGGTLSYTENSVTYPLGGKFKYFAIKLVLLASDPSVPPVVKNLRAIALPGG